jgi:hypothetical protein
MKKCMTPMFRASFATLFTPRAFEGQEPKYSIVMLFDKKQDLSEMKKLAAEALNEKWPDKAKRPSGLKNPFRDGDVEKPGIDGYEGKIFISANSKMKPGVVGPDCVPIITEDDFYSGCYARATVVCYAYDRAGNRGVAFGLQNVQKLKDGEPFSGRTRAEDDFDAVEGEAPDSAVSDVDDMFA